MFSDSRSFDRSRYEKMSTAQLEKLLSDDANCAGCELETDEIMCILDVLAARDAQNGKTVDVEAAAEVFRREYLPLDKGIKSLYDDEPEQPPVRRIKHRRLKLAAIAAIIALFIGGAAAYAADAPLWDAILVWSQDTFGLRAVEEQGSTTAVQLAELQTELSSQNAEAADVLPSYMPEGFELKHTDRFQMSDYLLLSALLSDGEREIVFQCRVYADASSAVRYHKDAPAPKTYLAGGIEHYYAQNEGVFVCFWLNGNVEFSVSGVDSEAELIKIIDSIYGG